MANYIYSPQNQVKKKIVSSSSTQLGVFLTISQKDDGSFEVSESTRGAVARFNSLEEAQKFCEVYRSRLMPTQQIKDVRVMLNSKLTPPMPFNRTEAEMNPIKITDGNFVPVDEDQNVVVEHPDDLITF